MKIYEVEQSQSEVQRLYSQLVDKLTDHVKILSLNGMPITTTVGKKSALIRLKIGYLNPEPLPETELSAEEEILVTEILECMGIEVKQAVDSGFIGIKEMKRRLVLYHYDKMAKQGKKYKDIKTELSKKYGITIATIEKIVYRTAKKVA
jgi:hypothetical protein